MPIIAGGLALTMAACGGPSQTATSGSTAGTTATPAAGGWDINETARDQLAEGGEFIGSISHEISTWNQFNVTGNDAELVFLEAPIRPTYYDYKGDGTPVINTDYLTAANEAVTDGHLVITLDLNPKAVWNDGTVISADDWIATWKAQNGSNKDFAAASTDGWNQITSVKAGTGPQQVVITFKSTYPDWTAIVAGGPLRAESAATPKVFNDGWADYNDAWFSGPFTVTNWDKTSGTVTMEPNAKWWGNKPLLTKLTWKNIQSDALASAFANQELDYYDIGADPDGYAQAKSAQNSVVRVAAGPNFRHFTFNSKSPVLSDQNVRQAIVMGIDRTVIAQSDLAGLPGDKVPLNNNLYVANQPGYVDQAKATGIDYNPDKAKSTLDAAGWTMNDSTGYREKDGKELDVVFAVLGGVAASENEGLQAQKSLKEIGVNLKLKTVDTNKDWPGVLTKHDFDIIAFSWIGTPYPLRNIGQIYGGTGTGDDFKANDSNFAQLDITKVNELIPQIDTEMDATKRADLGNQAAQAIWESVHTLPLYQRPMLIGVREKLANIGAMGMAQVPKWENVGFTK
ncbi:MAG: ABC transporter family substrate-binding protein [Propionicimonas sp.]|uniref:ABC transporter family substrate-binding protein n=1 Tax=Propionicimonas sp. TaxID=1955623 RepID=UPI003D1117E7